MHYSSASGSTTGAMPPWLAAYSSRVRLVRTATYGKSRIYDDRVGVSVSLSVREHISVTTRLIFTNF